MRPEFRIFCFSTLMGGLTMILPGSTLQTLIRVFELTESQAGFIGAAFFLGGLVGILLTSILISAFGARKSLGACFLVNGIGLCLMPIIGSFGLLLVNFFIIGAAFGDLVTMPGSVVSPIAKENSAGVLNFVYGFFALGVVIEPQVAGILLSNDFPWWTPYLIPGVLSTFGGLVCLAMKEFPEPPHQSPISPSLIVSLFRENPSIMIVGVVGTMLYVSSEVSMSLWMSKYLMDSFPDTESIYRANTALTLFWAGLTLGRMAYPKVFKSVPGWQAVAVSATVCAILIGAAPQLGARLPMEAGFVLSGLFFAVIYPTITGYSGKLSPAGSGAAFSVMAAGGQVGATSLPVLVGVLAEGGRFSLAMSLAALPLALLAVGMVAFSKKLG